MNCNFLSLLILFGFYFAGMAQENPSNNPKLSLEQEEIMATIIELFDGYRAADSSRIRAVFTENASLMHVGKKDGEPHLGGGSIDSFVNYVGSGLDKLHDEPLWDYEVHIDENLASVWTKYAFYLEGQFHHCGAESFQLFKSKEGWKIFLLVDTSKDECDVPDYIRVQSEKK